MRLAKNILIIYVLFLIIISPYPALAEGIKESEIKASWIHTLTEWLDWKTRPRNSKVTICTIGRDKVYQYLRKIKKRKDLKDKSRSFIILNKAPDSNFSRCHILYISNSEQEHFVDIVQRSHNYLGVASVSSIKGFARRGGTIEFVIRKKAYPVINLETANKSRIIIDNKLRGWSQIVR